MCIGTKFCSELGSDPSQWDRHSPLPPPDWMKDELDLFFCAVDEFLLGHRERCIEMIREIQSQRITEWYIQHGQMAGQHRKRLLNRPAPQVVSLSDRDPIRQPRKFQNAVFTRDNYTCRYCGNRLIDQAFLTEFILKLNSDVFRRGKTNLSKHGILHLVWPVADHVVPWNQGGRTDLNNLVASCPSCNYGKAGYTINELGIENPLDHPPTDTNLVGDERSAAVTERSSLMGLNCMRRVSVLQSDRPNGAE